MACFNLLCKLLFYVLYSSGCRKLVKNRRETSLSFPINLMIIFSSKMILTDAYLQSSHVTCVRYVTIAKTRADTYVTGQMLPCDVVCWSYV